MSYSLKQLLAVFFVTVVCAAALVNFRSPYLQAILRFTVFAAFVTAAYGTWVNVGERRAFSAGFLIWGMLYLLLHLPEQHSSFHLGTGVLLLRFSLWFMPIPSGASIQAESRLQFVDSGQFVLSLLFGLIGGWVTVYFYRKRQRMLEQSAR